MARVLILANSKRPDGQCVAGIDLDSGEWVRPVPAGGDGIPTNRCFVDGKFIEVRDVVEMDLIRPREIAEFQRENRFIKNWNWKVVGRRSFAALTQYVDANSPILHTPSNRVSPATLRKLQPAAWQSLQLVEPRNLRFGHHYFDANRWVANFADGEGNPYSLKITHPEITRRLEAGEKPTTGILLTVSMTKPWSPNSNEKPPFCYKVVAAAIAPK